MATIGTVELIATIDTGKYKKGGKEIQEINKDIEGSTEKTTKQGSEAWANFSSNALKYTKLASAGIAAGFALAVKNVASLEQSLGGSEVVFGKFADTVQKKAVNSFKLMGTSTNEYLETANKMGSLFQGAGFSVEKSMDLTTKAMQRAADVATAMGVSSEMAMESIAGAAKGNFTMMDNLGVAMNDTTIQAYALEKGITKSTSAMTTAEKTGLAMEMFLERTAKFAGNYARENETLAGSFQTLKGAFGNFLSGVEGSEKALSDAIIGMGGVLAKRLPEIAVSLAQGIQGLFTNLISEIDIGKVDPKKLGQQVAEILNAAVGFLTVGNDAIKGWFSGIDWGKLGIDIGRQAVAFVVGFIIGLMDFDVEAAFKVIADNWQVAVIGLVTTLFAPAKVAKPIGMMLSKLPLGNLFIKFFIRPIRNLGAPLREAFGSWKILDWVMAPFRSAGGAVGGVLNGLKGLIDNFINGLANDIRFLPDVVVASFRMMVRIIGELLLDGLNIARNIFTTMWNVVTTILRPFTTFFDNLFKAIWQNIQAPFQGAGNFFSNIFTGALNIVRSIWSAVGGFFSSVWGSITRAFSTVGSFFGNIFTGAYNSIVGIFNRLGGFFSGVWNNIVNMFGNAGTRVGDAIGGSFKWAINSVLRGAVNIINGFINSINWVIDIVRNIPGVGNKLGRLSQLAVPQLAQGGIITSPTLAMVGEGREAEAVIPLSKLDKMLDRSVNNENNSSITINLQGVFATSATEQRRIAQVIVDRIKEVEEARGLNVRY